MSIGDRIKERRIELGITQEDLAKKMGYKSRSSINKIELGINDIPQSKIVKFAQILRVSPGYLMEWEPKIKKATIIADEQKKENITLDFIWRKRTDLQNIRLVSTSIIF